MAIDLHTSQPMMKRTSFNKNTAALTITLSTLAITVAQSASAASTGAKFTDDLSPRGGSHVGEILREQAARAPRVTSLNLNQYSLSCKMNVLKKVGWTVNYPAATSSIKIQATDPCQANSLQELVQQKRMVLNLPASLQSSDLDAVLVNNGSLCGYKQHYHQAVKTATRKLDKNHFYIFNTPFTKGVVRLGTVDQWREQGCYVDSGAETKCYAPAGLIGSSIQALYTRAYSSECATGLQIAEYTTIAELFGTPKTDLYFQSQEFFVGDWTNAQNSLSVIHGQTGLRLNGKDGKFYGKLGYKALIGVPGYIGSVFPAEYLDDKTNANENALIVDATPEGADQLSKMGGQEYYFKYLRQIWEQSKLVDRNEIHALQKMAEDGPINSNWLKMMPYLRSTGTANRDARPSDAMIALAKMLEDPFLNTTQVYVHPTGAQSYAWHILRLARINPRTPYGIFFYEESTHAEIFYRWIKSELDSCAQ
jgi:hypothetical protein